jgi:hypothetical protein
MAAMSRRVRTSLLGLAVLLVVWAGTSAWLYSVMLKSPDDFGQVMKHVPMPAMMVLPFETLWRQARAGQLQAGDPAPDFDLPTVEKDRHVRLSDFRGKQPVVLVFGSYT